MVMLIVDIRKDKLTKKLYLYIIFMNYKYNKQYEKNYGIHEHTFIKFNVLAYKSSKEGECNKKSDN